MRAKSACQRIAASAIYGLSSPLRALATTVVAAVTIVVLVASAYPRLSVRMLAAGPEYWEGTFRMLLFGFVEQAGSVGVALAGLYAGLTGLLAVVVVSQLRTTGLSGVASVSGALPAVFVSGCAGCGAGVLGLMGMTGAVAALPFHGNGLRAFGVAVLVVLLARIGDPRRCRSPQNGS